MFKLGGRSSAPLWETPWTWMPRGLCRSVYVWCTLLQASSGKTQLLCIVYALRKPPNRAVSFFVLSRCLSWVRACPLPCLWSAPVLSFGWHMLLVHACTMTVVHACTMLIVHARAMKVEDSEMIHKAKEKVESFKRRKQAWDEECAWESEDAPARSHCICRGWELLVNCVYAL